MSETCVQNLFMLLPFCKKYILLHYVKSENFDFMTINNRRVPFILFTRK